MRIVKIVTKTVRRENKFVTYADFYKTWNNRLLKKINCDIFIT